MHTTTSRTRQLLEGIHTYLTALLGFALVAVIWYVAADAQAAQDADQHSPAQQVQVLPAAQ